MVKSNIIHSKILQDSFLSPLFQKSLKIVTPSLVHGALLIVASLPPRFQANARPMFVRGSLAVRGQNLKHNFIRLSAKKKNVSY